LFDSPKTAHLEGRERRAIPIFKELRPYLEALQGSKESDFVFGFLRDGSNARQQVCKLFKKALESAGLEPWPRLLSNLRASRATEIALEFGSKAESAWIGHGADTAMNHYLMVTETTWRKAVEGSKGQIERAAT